MSNKVSKTFTVSEDTISKLNTIAEAENTSKVDALCKAIKNFNTEDVSIDNTSYKNIYFKLPTEVVQILEDKAKILGIPLSQIIRLAIMQYIGNNQYDIGNNQYDNDRRTRNRATQKQRLEFDKLLNDRYFSTKDK